MALPCFYITVAMVGDVAMFDGVVDVIDVSGVVAVIAEGVFPSAALP